MIQALLPIKRILQWILGAISYRNLTDCDLTIVVLSWNRADLTVQSLRSVMKTTAYLKRQVILLDNASKEEDQKILRSLQTEFPEIEFIFLPENIGAKAFRLVQAKIRGEYVLFCENDIIFREHWFDRIKYIFEQHQNLGQLSPQSALPAAGVVWPTKEHVEVGEGSACYLRSFSNLGTTSVVPKRVLRRGVFWGNLPQHGDTQFCFPDDGGFSGQIRRRGFINGWMREPVAFNLGHAEAEWLVRQDYYLENWQAKISFGIDGMGTENEEVMSEDFQTLKLQQEVESLRSRIRILQRSHPEWFAKHEIIPEKARVFVDQGEGFRAEDFVDFFYRLNETNQISLDLKKFKARRLRIDIAQFPSKVGQFVPLNQEAKYSLRESDQQTPEIWVDLGGVATGQFDFKVSVEVRSL